MGIYFSYSDNCKESADKIIHLLKKSGWEVSFDHPSDLNDSAALLLYICSEDNQNIKAELNMALERKLPVGYILEEESLTDPGLKLQLGLAHRIEPDNPEDMKAWLLSVLQERESKKKTASKKKMGNAFLIIILCALVFAAAFYLFGNKSSEEENLPPMTLSEKYLGEEPLKLKTLDLSGEGLTDISFLVGAENLEELDLSYNDIKDINPLVTLKKLKRLNLTGNPIEDDQILEYMKDVEIIR